MPRSARDDKLDTRSARLRLSPRHSPYWRNIQEGRAIGYRRPSAGRAGQWQARFLDRDDNEKRVWRFASLGTADDLLDADGIDTLNFAQAQDKAREWFSALTQERRGSAKPITVTDAMTAYVSDYKARGGKDVKGLETTIAAHITEKLGEKKVASLNAAVIRAWHHALANAAPRVRTSNKPGKQKAPPKPLAAGDIEGQRARRASANRILTVLKAALNLAFQDGKVEGDSAWRRVAPFKGADAPRIRYFTDAEAKQLVNAADEVFRPMIQAALLSGARYGELARLRAADLNLIAGTLHIRAGKTGKSRDVALTDEGIKFFKAQGAGKIGIALMLTQPGGEPWGKSHQFRPMRAACKAANISPAIGFHILRHAYASRLVMAGVPLGVVAAQIGNSEAICAKHYAHHSPQSVAETVRCATAELGIVQDSNLAAVG